MSEFDIIAASTKTYLDSLRKQINALGEGLQNAAPEKAGAPNKSVQYLLNMADTLSKIVEEFDKFLSLPHDSQPRP